MATNNNTQTHAQATQESQGSKESQENAADIDPAVLACQHRAREQTRRAKQRARWRDREFIVRRADGDERAGLGTGDRRGEVV